MNATMPADIGWIQTASGGRFYPLAPRVKDVKILDIAQALSRNCRFTGHCSKFYSVAEHSVLVTSILDGWTDDPEVLMWGLLHDASEAYISDIARPVKQQPEFKFYRDMEKGVMDVIAAAFGLDPTEPSIVKDADTMALSLEAEQLMPNREKASWAWLPDSSRYARHHILGRSPDTAQSWFLETYHNLESLRA